MHFRRGVWSDHCHVVGVTGDPVTRIKEIGMKNLLPFIALSIFTWGPYVPCMHAAGKLLKSPARSYLMVCVAYCVVGVVTFFWMKYKGIDPLTVHSIGSPVAFVGGVLGALGALGIVLAVIKAFETGTSPLPIAPIVFCGAPIVATLIGMFLERAKIDWGSLDWRFFVGIVGAAVCTGMTMYFAPKGH